MRQPLFVQAKRTNIGIAMITNPRVLFLDEPTSGLDSYTAHEVCRPSGQPYGRLFDLVSRQCRKAPFVCWSGLHSSVCLAGCGITVEQGFRPVWGRA